MDEGEVRRGGGRRVRRALGFQECGKFGLFGVTERQVEFVVELLGGGNNEAACGGKTERG